MVLESRPKILFKFLNGFQFINFLVLSLIIRKVWVKFQQTESVSNKKKSCRPKKIRKGDNVANSHFQEGPF